MNNPKFNTQHSTLKSIPCVILSGGKSSRMGEDKSLLPFGNYPSMIEYQYHRLKPYFKEVYISTKTNKFNFKANLIYDQSEIYSPMIALKAIFEYLKDESIFIITVDTPLVDINNIFTLIEHSSNFDATIARTSFKSHNLCGLFKQSLYKNITEVIKQDIHKINFLLKKSNVQYIDFPKEEDFININEPNDYEKGLQTIRLYNNTY